MYNNSASEESFVWLICRLTTPGYSACMHALLVIQHSTSVNSICLAFGRKTEISRCYIELTQPAGTVRLDIITCIVWASSTARCLQLVLLSCYEPTTCHACGICDSGWAKQ